MAIDSNGKWSNPYWYEIRAEHGDGAIAKTFDDIQRYLGGWVDDSGRYPILSNETGGGARGNAVVKSFYKVQGDECWWVGQYVPGNTTAFAAVAMTLTSPVPIHPNEYGYQNIGGIMNGEAKAYNGNVYWAHGDIVIGLPPTIINLVGTGVPGAGWTNLVPFAWAANNQLVWNFRLRIDPKART